MLEKGAGEVPALKEKIEALPEAAVTDTLKETIALQQKALMSLQFEQRSKNLIVTGVPEQEGSNKEVKKKDEQEVEGIMVVAGCPGVVLV